MNKLIATLRKNATEEVRIGLEEYRGYDLVSIRVWTDPYAETKRVATKKGISIAVRLLLELIAALHGPRLRRGRRDCWAAKASRWWRSEREGTRT